MSPNVCRRFGNDKADGLAHSGSVADALHCLELDLARDQSRSARFAADLIRRDSLSDCDRCFDRRFGWAYPFAAKGPIRLWCTRFHWRADVRDQLCALVLGRTVRVFWAGGDLTGINSDFRNGICPLALAGGAVALAASARRIRVNWRGRANL